MKGPAWTCALSVLTAVGCSTPEASIDRTEGGEGLRGLELEEAFEAPSFALRDTEGQTFDFRDQTAGSLTLLFFGYTHCPDICPVQMSILDAALSDLAYTEREKVEVVFVTTDPARDSPERLRAWLDRFDTSFVGLIGDLARVNEVQAALGLPAARIADTEAPTSDTTPREYYVGHATPVVAITGDGRVRALYPSGVRQTDWRHDLPLLLSLNAAVSSEARPSGAGAGG